MLSIVGGVLLACGVCASFIGSAGPCASTDGAGIKQWIRVYRRAPRSYTLVPFWFWNDDLDEREIKRQIDDFRAHGVDGFLIHARMGLPKSIPFMSDRFLHFVRVAVEYAAKRHMVVHLYDEGMYPSGSAAGRVVAENPAFAARCLVERDVPPGVEPQLEPNERLVTVASLPDGKRVAIVDAPSMGKIRGVHEGQDDGEPEQPPAGDLLNPEATACFIRHVHDRFYQVLAPHFGRTVKAVFTDEPDVLGRGHRKGAQPWTTGLDAYLDTKLGYDVKPRLAELWHDLRPDSAEFRRAYAAAIQARLEETFYAPLSRWCAEHKVALTGHPAGPDDIGVLRQFQVPGQDVVWRYVEPGKPSALQGPQSTMAKCTSSVAEHLGRPRNGNEAFGAYGWQLTYAEMTWLTDWLMVRGVNLIWPHAFYYSVRGARRDERPPDVGPNNTWWGSYGGYAEYVRRMCRLVAEGEHQCSVAILGSSDELPWKAARACYERQIDFNYLESRHLLDGSAKVSADGIALGGHTYGALVLDGLSVRDGALGRALAPMIATGRVLTYSGATCPGAAEAASPQALTGGIERLVAAPLSFEPDSPGLRVRPMRFAGADVVYVFNEGESAVRAAPVFAEARREVWAVDPRRLTSAPVPEGGAIELAPHQVVLLVAFGGE